MQLTVDPEHLKIISNWIAWKYGEGVSFDEYIAYIEFLEVIPHLWGVAGTAKLPKIEAMNSYIN